jgi:hypothetical protein
MKPTLTKFQDQALGEITYASNFWSTERVEPGATYELRATRSDGKSSTVEVTIPPSHPLPVVEIVLSSNTDRVRLQGIENFAMIHVVHHVRSECVNVVPFQAVNFPVPGAPVPPGTELLLPVHIRGATVPALDTVCLAPFVKKREIFIVSSGIPWPYRPTTPDATVRRPEFASNVGNGVGFVGGVLTTRLPYESCVMNGTARTGDICILSYGPETATLTGHVTDPHCHRNLESWPVRLTMSDEDRVRTAVSDLFGSFEIRGIRPGIPYTLSVRGGIYHIDYDEVITFAPGERAHRNIELFRRSGFCPP